MIKDMLEIDCDKIKLCDFGLATHVDVKDYLYKRCGTPGYVAPEIVNADSNDPHFRSNSKCDAFSVGVIMYLLLSISMSKVSWCHPVSRRNVQNDTQTNIGV